MALAQTTTPVPSAASDEELKTVLAQMDQASTRFTSAQADVELVQYTELVKETSTQTGMVFFRRRGNELDVALRIVAPHAKQVVVKNGKLSYYDAKTGQLRQRDVRNNRADVESVMNLGFGGRGRDLLKDYDVKWGGWETVDNVKTARLELAPKSDRLKQFFVKMILWIDAERDVAVKQQRIESSGDYQLSHYSGIKVNGKIADDVFHVK